jgi:hypothetical protein
MQWIRRQQVAAAAGRTCTYYYCRRPGFPIVRMPGEPGSPEFVATHEAILQATTPGEVQDIRTKTGTRDKGKRRELSTADAIIAWAEHKPLTPEQIVLVSQALGAPVDYVLRRPTNGDV